MQELYHHLVDLPNIPEHFLPDFYDKLLDPQRQDTSLNHTRPSYTARSLTNGQWIKSSTRSQRFDTDPLFKAWIKDHVVDTWTECSISVTETSLGDIHGPHTDWSRHWVLMYVLDTGGDQCRTVWYQEKNKPVVRSQDLGCYITDYNDAIEIGHVRMSASNWYVINSQILHGVEQLSRDRVAIQIGLWNLDGIKSQIIDQPA